MDKWTVSPLLFLPLRVPLDVVCWRGSFQRERGSIVGKKRAGKRFGQMLFFHVSFLLFGPSYFILRIPSALFPLFAILLSVSGRVDNTQICFGDPLCDGSNVNLFLGYTLFALYFLSWILLLFRFTRGFYYFHHITWYFAPGKRYTVNLRSRHRGYLRDSREPSYDFVEDSKILYFDIVMEKEGTKIVKEFFGKGVGGIIMSYVSGCFDDKMKVYYGIEKKEEEVRVLGNDEHEIDTFFSDRLMGEI